MSPKDFCAGSFIFIMVILTWKSFWKANMGCTCVIAAGETENAKFKVSAPGKGLGIPSKALKENKEGRRERGRKRWDLVKDKQSGQQSLS